MEAMKAIDIPPGTSIDMQILSLVATKLLYFLIRLLQISYSSLALIVSLLGKILGLDARYVKVVQEIILGFLLLFLDLAAGSLLIIAEQEIICKRVKAPKQAPKEYSGPPATSFELFPDLPLEIRRMIWHLAAKGPQIVVFKELYTGEHTKPFEGPTYDLGRTPCWMTTLGSTGGIRTVCKEANDEASKFRLPSYIDVEKGASGEIGLELRNRDFEVIWLTKITSLKFLEDYWCGKNVDDNLPRKIAVSFAAWKLQMNDKFVSQLIVRLRRLGISEVFVVVDQGKPEETLIRFDPPKNAPFNLEMNAEIMGVQRKCVSWSQFEVDCRLKLQALNVTDVKQRKKYFLQGGDSRRILKLSPQYTSYRMWKSWSAPKIRCVEAKFVG